MPKSRRSFLLTTLQLGGSVSPIMEMARKLKAAGHDVRVMSDQCNRIDAEAIGVAFVPWSRATSKPDLSRDHELIHDYDCRDVGEVIAMLIDTVLIGQARNYAADVLEELRRKPTDLVVSLDFLLGVHVACESIGQPFVQFTANVALFPAPGIPPFGLGMTPARTETEEAMQAAMGMGLHAVMDSFLPQLNDLRAEFGLGSLRRFADHFATGSRHLLGVAPSFDFTPHRMPAEMVYAGPQLAEPAWAEPWTAPFRARAGRKRALIAFSTTFQNHAGALQNVIDAVATLPIDAVLTLGSVIYAHELKTPDNVALVDSAPHGQAMADCDIVVTHGGHGTVAKALVAGKPLLVMPHGRDQADNAIRVTHRGAGLSLPANASPLEITAALRRLTEEPSFTQGAQALGARIKADMAEIDVAEILVDIADRNCRSRLMQQAA